MEYLILQHVNCILLRNFQIVSHYFTWIYLCVMDVFYTWVYMIGVIITGLHRRIASKTVLESYVLFFFPIKPF